MSTRARARAFQTVPAVSVLDTDWVTRSTASGVARANRLDTQSVITDWFLNDSTGDHMSLDTSVKPHASAGGSLKNVVLNSDTTGSGQFSIPFSTSYGQGDTFWVSFRHRAPPEQAYQSWPPAASANEGHKICIVSRDANGAAPTGSNQINELVIQVNNNAGMISGYWRYTGTTGNPVEIGFVSSVNSGDFRDQPSIDRGANPLVGTNPDTGAAWTTNEQERARYGVTYGARSSPGAANYRQGLGDPFTGGFRLYPNEWITITMRVEVGTWDVSDSRWSVWAAREDQPYELLWDKQNIPLGPGPDYNALNLLPYTSGRAAGGRKITGRTTNIGGCSIHVCGLTTPVGSGLLEYNASTQRFRWAGQGETFGTARGFSSANDILWINVTSGTATESYVVVEITNPALLPSSGIATDAVTIADGRPDTQVNNCDFIESTLAINAPGGYAPAGVSVLEDLAASMSPGTWAQLTPTPSNQNNAIGRVPNNTNMCAQLNGGVYSPQERCIHIHGQGHNEFTGMRLVKYFLNLNDYVEIFEDPTNIIGTGHGFDHTDISPFTGDLWHRCRLGEPSTLQCARLPVGSDAASDWQVSATVLGGYVQVALGAWYWSGAFTPAGSPAQGLFMIFNSGASNVSGGASTDGTIVGYNPLTNTWVYNATSRAPNYGAGGSSNYHSVGAYSRIANLVVYGGGNVAAQRMWRMTSDGTVTEMPTAPIGIGIGTGNTGQFVPQGRFFENPVNGKFLLLGNGALYELDPSGAGSYTLLTGSHVPPSGVGNPNVSSTWVVPIPIHELGVVVVLHQDSGTNGSFWVYKPSP